MKHRKPSSGAAGAPACCVAVGLAQERGALGSRAGHISSLALARPGILTWANYSPTYVPLPLVDSRGNNACAAPSLPSHTDLLMDGVQLCSPQALVFTNYILLPKISTANNIRPAYRFPQGYMPGTTRHIGSRHGSRLIPIYPFLTSSRRLPPILPARQY